MHLLNIVHTFKYPQIFVTTIYQLALINFRKFITAIESEFCTTTLKEENSRLILVNRPRNSIFAKNFYV